MSGIPVKSVATYQDLPTGLGSAGGGSTYLVMADGKYYTWTGTAWPANGSGTSSPSNPAAVLPGITVTGTGVEADRVTANSETYTSTAGDWGALGNQVSNYSQLTEGYVRDILGANLGGSDAWMSAWAGLCDLIASFPLFGGLMDLVSGADSQIHALLGGAQQFIEDLLNAVTCGAYSNVHPDDIFNAINGVLNSIKSILGIDPNFNLGQVVTWITDQLNCIWQAITGGSLAAGINKSLTDIITFVSTLFNNFLNLFGVNQTLSGIITWLQGVANCIWGVFSGVADATGKTLKAAWDAVGSLLSSLLGHFAPGTFLTDLVGMVGSLIALLGSTLGNGVTQIINFFQGLIDILWNAFSWLIGGATGLGGKTLVDLLTMFGTWIDSTFGGLVRGAGSILHQIVSAITGVGIGQIADPLTMIASFFNGLSDGSGTLMYNILSNIAASLGQTIDSLTGWALKLVGLDSFPVLLQKFWGVANAVIPIGNINTPQEKVNLLTLGEFKTAATLQAANGWSWDSANDHTGGNAGGCAKLDCSVVAGTKELFSNQNIKVSPGDKLAAFAYIKTSLNFNGGGGSIVLSIIPFAGTVQKPTVTLVSSAGSAGWYELTNDSSPWEVPKYTSNPYGFGNNPSDQITSVQVRLAVTASAGTVYWDDIKLYKNGLLQQGLVDTLLGAFSGIFDGLKGYSQGTTSLSAANTANMVSAASAARGLANTANSAAVTATDNNQKIANSIATTVGGQPSGVDYAPAGVSGHFSSFFSKLYGAGASTPQDYVPQGTISNLPNTFGGMIDAFNKQPFGTNGTVTGTGSAFYTSVTANTGLIGTASSNAEQAKTSASNADTLATAVASSNNLILSPDFEESSIRRVAVNAGLAFTISYSTDQKRSGTQSLKLYATNSVNSNSTGQWGGVYLSPVKSDNSMTYFMVAPGQVYNYDIYCYGAFNGSGQSASVNFQVYDYLGNNSTTGNAATALVKNTWTRIKGTITVPTNVSGGSEVISMLPMLAIYGSPVNAGDTYYIDRAIIYR